MIADEVEGSSRMLAGEVIFICSVCLFRRGVNDARFRARIDRFLTECVDRFESLGGQTYDVVGADRSRVRRKNRDQDTATVGADIHSDSCLGERGEVRFWHKADIRIRLAQVCF